MYRVVQKKVTVLLSTSLAAARQKLSLNLAPFLLLNPVEQKKSRDASLGMPNEHAGRAGGQAGMPDGRAGRRQANDNVNNR